MITDECCHGQPENKIAACSYIVGGSINTKNLNNNQKALVYTKTRL